MSEPSDYDAGDPVEDWVNCRIWIDEDDDLWIGKSESGAGLLTHMKWAAVIGAMQDAQPDRLTAALESAGVLPDAAADASETGESADVTPVTDVGDLCAGDRVTATDGGGTSETGTLESVEVNLNAVSNTYHVEFSDGSMWYATHVEPAADADNDESRSPEDVAERWLKATDGTGKTAWAPVNESLSVGVTEHGNLDLESGDMVTPVSHKSDQWYAKDVDRVDAADVPSEVLDDE